MSPKALWIACLPTDDASPPEPAGPWLAQYAPHPVAHEDGWLLEASASARLFGGRQALLQQLQHEGQAQGWGRLGAAPTALAALACARATPAHGGACWALGPDWSTQLDALPCTHLGPARPHRHVLDALGLRTLGALRQCPREGLARRTAPALLDALDALYGQTPWVQPSWQAPAQFYQSLDLPAPSADAAALTFAAQRLLRQLLHWLRQRQAGVLHWSLGWQGLPTAAALVFRHRQPLCDETLLRQLLQDALARTRLDAAVDGLWLQTHQIAPWQPPAAHLLPGAAEADEGLSWNALLERLSARLGAERVQTVCIHAHWDPRRRQQWQPAHSGATAGTLPAGTADGIASAALWEPAWWLPQPRPLPTNAQGQPLLDGRPLQRLLGPQRIATGWWEADPLVWESCVARSPDGRCWWLQRSWPRAAPRPGPWQLAGIYT